MSLRQNDLKDTILKKISYDEFEPKTGDSDNIAVIGFYVNGQSAGNDLYSFLNSSVVETRDIEVSPNPNDEGYYMVFVEMDKNENLLANVIKLVKEVEHVSGKLDWQAKNPYMEDYAPLEEVLMGRASEALQDSSVESQQEEIMEFLSNTNLLNVKFKENIIDLKDARGNTQLEVVGFGYGPDVLSSLNINESAIKIDFDKFLFDKLKSMLGEMRALPIDDYIVIYDPARKDVLVTKPC